MISPVQLIPLPPSPCSIACLEEVAYRQGFITADHAHQAGDRFIRIDYGRMILNTVNDL